MKTTTKLTLIRYWQEIRKHWFLTSAVVLFVSLASVSDVIIPLYYKDFFNVLTNGQTPANQTRALIGILVFVALFELTRWVMWRLASITNNELQPRIIADLTNQCYAYMHKHSFAFFNNNFVGSLVKRISYFTRAFENIADRFTWNILPLIVEMSFVLVVLLRLNLVLGLAAAGWILLFTITNWIFATYKIKFDVQRSAAGTKSTAHLADTVTNNNNVKLFVGYARELASFGKLVEEVRKLRRFTWNLDNVFEGIQGGLAATINILLLYIAIRLWVVHKLTIGDFVLLQAYVMTLVNSVWNFGKLLRGMYTDLADANEMTDILETPHEIQDVTHAPKLVVTGGKIPFSHVDFHYHATRKIFSDFNLEIQSHEKVALVGPSGAGKSTVVKLLLRMHDIAGGKISIDGQQIDRVTQESLWQNISLVPQDPILFHRSLMENIRYGKPEASDDEVIAASKLAHCHEFITEFPEGYGTYVGERGVKLSGGERQRVAIARAILRNAPILVLDEATSSLDSESEHLIQDALNVLMQNKTVIVIAHRLSTIMRMDRIMVINHGRVVEEGTHDSLLRNANSLYKQLWTLQAGGFLPSQPAETDLPEKLNALDKKTDLVENVLSEQTSSEEPETKNPPAIA